ncbi:Isocitrate lyase family [Musa troglodytarum]|uniref:Isocitrate lyase family n=1 Tax=Musa troglodytarum TaxID=320322 RepID=A0A9E7I0C5_9LILI|nr:Isocitrate lyase family [Musa troglodytarum]
MISESAAVYRGPACFDAVSGKLVGKAGVQFRFTSGREEMKAFAMYSFTSKNGQIVCTEKLAGMLEGGERTPILNPVELEIGSMLVSYPLSLIGYQSQHWRLEWSKYYKRQKHWKPSLRLQQ